VRVAKTEEAVAASSNGAARVTDNVNMMDFAELSDIIK
jgi:hypothetical protein